MQIEINDRYRLKGEESQWVVERRLQDKDGNLTDRYTPAGYFTTIQGAVEALVQHQVRTSDARSLAEALEAVSRIVEDVTAALSPHFTVSVSTKRRRTA